MKTMIISALAALTLISCKQILDVKPVTFSSGNAYYQNPEQIETAVNGAYGVLQTVYTTGEIWAFTEMRSDNTTYQYNPNNRCCITREEIDEFLNTPVDRYTEALWRTIYSGIQQSNVILNRIQGVTFSDETKKQRLEGEAQFLRALYYFHLVRLFGAVPLVLHEVQGPQDAVTGLRTEPNLIYEQILVDANAAAASLPESYPDSEAGRATRGAALTLLGEVYMTLKDYPKAMDYFDEVLAMGYDLEPDYASIYDPGNKNNNELIFSIQFNASVEGENSNFFFTFGPYNAGFDLTGFQPQLGGMNIPTLDMIRAYEPGDKRKEVSIGFYVKEENESMYESIGDTMPYIKKFYHPPFTQNGRTDDNWPIYRYAHVLLMMAEALNEAGNTGDALPYLNRVRQRAELDPLSGLNQAQLRDALNHEKRVELAFENHRWFDLLRTEKALEVMNAHGIEEKARLDRLSPSAFNVEAYMLLFPIPEKEARLNGLSQNDGY